MFALESLGKVWHPYEVYPLGETLPFFQGSEAKITDMAMSLSTALFIHSFIRSARSSGLD